MQLFTYAVLAVATAGFVLLRFLQSFREKNGPPRLPGPMLLPWIGRVHDLPIQYMWLKFKEWADIYGKDGLYRTEMLGAKFIVVSDEKVAEDLLVKRAKYNSDRPMIRSLFDSKSSHGSMEYLPLMGKNSRLISWKLTPMSVPKRRSLTNQETEYWARQRRFTHAYLTEATNAQYYGVMDFEAKRWMYRLINDPDDFAFSLEDMTAKVMCQLTWDDTTDSAVLAKSAWGLLTQMSPAGPITNLITPLWHLPWLLNPWKRAERKRHDDQQEWWMAKLVKVREMMAKGHMRACWTRTYLENAAKTNLSGDHEASSVIGMMALVGIFTVAGPLHYFLVSMVYHPEWQTEVQKEVDRVCGGRLPTISDMPNLPILRACIKETMRWKPNVPTGVAHEIEQDDEYNGYLIPKGTRILPLDWAFLRNPIKYPDPDNFRPERWLRPGWPTYQEPLTQFPTIKGMTSFGWGQRQCLGQSVTQDELVVACGALAWCFTLKHKRDPHTTRDIPIPLDKSNSLLIIKPDPFQMAFEPRSEARRQEAVRLWREAEAEDLKQRADFVKRTKTPVKKVLDEKLGIQPTIQVLEV